MTLLTVERDDIVEWLDSSPLCNRTRGLYVTRLDVLFKWMVEEEIRSSSPSARIPKPKVPRSMPRPWSTAGLQAALASAGERTALIVAGHLRSCGINATTHQGRHWFATQVYRASGDLRVTQEMMGHASPSTTAVYAAWSPERAVTAIAALPARTANPEEAA